MSELERKKEILVMKKNVVPVAVLIIVFLTILACGTETPALTEDASVYAAQTIAAYTAEAALTQSIVPTSNVLPTETPQTQVIPSPTLSENAPDPLPAVYTGITLSNGQCFDFDAGMVTAPDASCDVWLAEPALFRQMNLSQVSGYVTMSAPTRNYCANAQYETGDLAVQTDLYYCFITNTGKVGFIVARAYTGGIPSTGILFDYWVFP